MYYSNVEMTNRAGSELNRLNVDLLLTVFADISELSAAVECGGTHVVEVECCICESSIDISLIDYSHTINNIPNIYCTEVSARQNNKISSLQNLSMLKETSPSLMYIQREVRVKSTSS